ncbi:MAG: hypothetical protein ACI9SP_003629 [Arenicella sp.]|jgi:hypothetical protein
MTMNVINSKKQRTYLAQGTRMNIRSVYKIPINPKALFRWIAAAQVLALSLLQASVVLAKDLPGSSETSWNVSP